MITYNPLEGIFQINPTGTTVGGGGIYGGSGSLPSTVIVDGNLNGLTFGTTSSRITSFNVNTSSNLKLENVSGSFGNLVNLSTGGIAFASTNSINNDSAFLFSSVFTNSSRLGFTDGLTGNQAYIDITKSSGIIVRSDNGIPAKYNSDYFGILAYPTDNRAIPDVGLVSSTIGKSFLDASVISPSISEDGKVISWDNTLGKWTAITPSGGSGTIPITQNFIPKGNSTSNNIIDSNLFITFTDTSGVDTTLFKWQSGTNTTKRFSISGSTSDTSGLSLAFEATSSTKTSELLATSNFGVSVGTQSSDTVSVLRIGNLATNSRQLQIVTRTGTGTQYVTSLGAINVFGQKYGTGGNQLDQNASDSYTLRADNEQRVIIGSSFGVSSENVHCLIHSNSSSPNPRSHIGLRGDFGGVSAIGDIVRRSTGIFTKGIDGIEYRIDKETSEFIDVTLVFNGSIASGTVIPIPDSNTIALSYPIVRNCEIEDISILCGLSTISASGNLPIDIREVTTSSSGIGTALSNVVGTSKIVINANIVSGTTYSRTFFSTNNVGLTLTQGNSLFAVVGTVTYTGSIQGIVVSLRLKKL